MQKSNIFVSTIILFGLTACQSPSVNTVIQDTSSPNGDYHLEVRQCRANDVMFGKATQVQVSVLKKGLTEKCRANINSVAQFDVYTINLNHKAEELQLVWRSNTELQAWHPSFTLSEHKKYIGPSSTYSINGPVKLSFKPIK